MRTIRQVRTYEAFAKRWSEHRKRGEFSLARAFAATLAHSCRVNIGLNRPGPWERGLPIWEQLSSVVE